MLAACIHRIISTLHGIMFSLGKPCRLPSCIRRVDAASGAAREALPARLQPGNCQLSPRSPAQHQEAPPPACAAPRSGQPFRRVYIDTAIIAVSGAAATRPKEPTSVLSSWEATYFKLMMSMIGVP